MRHRDVLRIWISSERLLTDFCGLWVTSWSTDSMLSMLLIVRDRSGRCLSATVPSALNLATIRRIQLGEGWFIFPVFLMNALCVLTEHLLSKLSWTIRVSWIIDNLSIFSGEEEKYHYAVKFIVIFSMYDMKQISWHFAFEC